MEGELLVFVSGEGAVKIDTDIFLPNHRRGNPEGRQKVLR
jgi:hypothetical protein